MNGRGRGEKERGVRREGGGMGGERRREMGRGAKREEKQRHNENGLHRQAETDRQTGRQEA